MQQVNTLHLCPRQDSCEQSGEHLRGCRETEAKTFELVSDSLADKVQILPRGMVNKYLEVCNFQVYQSHEVAFPNQVQNLGYCLHFEWSFLDKLILRLMIGPLPLETFSTRRKMERPDNWLLTTSRASLSSIFVISWERVRGFEGLDW